jgi:hypothetical protein
MSTCQDSGTFVRRSNKVHGGAYCEACDRIVPTAVKVTNTAPYVKADYYTEHEAASA